MRKKTKTIPAILMLMASAITSIVCYILKYEIMTMLLTLIVVMLIFYMLGDVIRFFFDKYVYPPKEHDDEEAEGEAVEEGSVIEKETTGENTDKKEK